MSAQEQSVTQMVTISGSICARNSSRPLSQQLVTSSQHFVTSLGRGGGHLGHERAGLRVVVVRHHVPCHPTLGFTRSNRKKQSRAWNTEFVLRVLESPLLACIPPDIQEILTSALAPRQLQGR
jgi:hypothetical protein